MTKSFQVLVEAIQKTVEKKELTRDATFGKVSCVLETNNGKYFVGKNLSTAADLGFCAEISAIAQMLNTGESHIKSIVAVTQNGQFIPPCGRCRELMYQINRKNLNTSIYFNKDKSIKLNKLLPHRWQEHWADR